jgi:transcriptional regulator with XRE-family HTH domain
MSPKNKEVSVLEHIRTIRIRKGLSQENIAIDLGIEQSTYQKIERGKTAIKLVQLFQIVDILELDLIHFLKNSLAIKKETFCVQTAFSEIESNLAGLKGVVLKG